MGVAHHEEESAAVTHWRKRLLQRGERTSHRPGSVMSLPRDALLENFARAEVAQASHSTTGPLSLTLSGGARIATVAVAAAIAVRECLEFVDTGCSAKCFSIGGGGFFVSEARSRRAGGTSRSELMKVRKHGHIIDPGNYWAWRGIKVFWFLEQPRAWEERWWTRKRGTNTFRFIRSFEDHALCRSFAPVETNHGCLMDPKFQPTGGGFTASTPNFPNHDASGTTCW
ncbi:hypothetical protein EDB85DRAFT_2277427 [Lactarius pseudohatsudake]|nr:hypothetical protein EDB85DRAFT_2277427 [Lactarius pseudohatsudake]